MAMEAGTPTTEEAQPAQPDTQALKVVINLRGGLATIGVHRPNTDPWIRMVRDVDLAGALAQLPNVLAEATVHWQQQPQYPRYERPAPAPRPQAPATATTQPDLKPAAPKPQSKLF